VLIVIVTLADRQRRADALATAAEEDDWPVQESYSVDQALECWAGVGGLLPRLHPRITAWFPHPVTPPDGGDRYGARCRPGPAAGPVVPLSAITALPSIDGILQELPEIIEKAAAWRGLLVPPAQESSLAGGRSVSPGYRPSGVTRSSRASRPSGSARRERRRPLGLKALVSSYAPLTKGLTDVGFPTAPTLEPNLTDGILRGEAGQHGRRTASLAFLPRGPGCRPPH